MRNYTELPSKNQGRQRSKKGSMSHSNEVSRQACLERVLQRQGTITEMALCLVAICYTSDCKGTWRKVSDDLSGWAD